MKYKFTILIISIIAILIYLFERNRNCKKYPENRNNITINMNYIDVCKSLNLKDAISSSSPEYSSFLEKDALYINSSKNECDFKLIIQFTKDNQIDNSLDKSIKINTHKVSKIQIIHDTKILKNEYSKN